MKKQFLKLTILLTFILMGFSSCAGLFQRRSPTPSVTEKVTVRGFLSLNRTLSKEYSSENKVLFRSAFAGTDVTALTFSVTAESTDGLSSKTGTVTDDHSSFSIPELDVGREYVITVLAQNEGTTVLKGSCSLVLSASNSSGLIINLSPLSEGTGTISLPIDTGDVSVSFITYQLDKNPPETFVNDSSRFVLTIPDVESGGHLIDIRFYHTETDGVLKADNLVYQCVETVNVLPNMTTDTWIRNATTGTRHLVPNGKTFDDCTTSGVWDLGQAQFMLNKALSKEFTDNQIYVSSTYTGTDGNGSIWKPYTTLTEALEEQVINYPSRKSQDTSLTIRLEAGKTETLADDVNLTDTRFIIDTYGISSGEPATIDTNGHSIILDDSTEVTFSQITFTNSADESPVIVTNDSASTMRFENCSFTNKMDSYHSVITTKGKLILKGLFAFDQNQFITISDSNIITLDTSFTTGDGQIPLAFTDITGMRGKSPFTNDSDVQKTDSFTIYGNDNYYMKDDGTIALVSIPISGTFTFPTQSYDAIMIQIGMDMDEDGNMLFPILFFDLTGNPLDDVVITKVIVDCAGENPKSSENTWKLVDTVLVFSPEFMQKIEISNAMPGIYAFFTYNGQPYSAYLPFGF